MGRGEDGEDLPAGADEGGLLDGRKSVMGRTERGRAGIGRKGDGKWGGREGEKVGRKEVGRWGGKEAEHSSNRMSEHSNDELLVNGK